MEAVNTSTPSPTAMQEVEMKEEIKEQTNKDIKKCAKLWSERDEISLLSGYYEYQKTIKPNSTHVGGGGFFEFIKHRLIRSSLKQSQVSDKICRLKKKYMDLIASKSNAQHIITTGSDPHLQKLFEFSTKIWSLDAAAKDDSSSIVNDDDHTLLSPIDGLKFEYSNNYMCKEFLDFLYNQGVDVDFLETETLTDLKRKFGELELSRSKFEFKQAKLMNKMEKLKYDHYNRAFHKFFQSSD